MKKTWTLLMSLCSLTVWSEDLKPQFEAGTAFVWGQATELVLRNGTYDDPISRLVWDVPPALALRVAAQWPWADWTSTRIELQTALPMKTGTVVDEDWETGTTDDDLVYGRSTSTAKLTSRWDGRVEETFTWNGIRFLGGGRVLYTAWTADGGEYDYSYVGSNSGHAQHETGDLPSGTSLKYQQTWLIPYLGVEYTWVGQSSSVTTTLRGFPWTICYDVDDHPLRGITFYDTLRGGWYGQGSVELTLPGTWQWGARLSGEIAYGAVGDTVESYSGGSATFLNAAGAWFQELSLAIFVRN